MRTAHPDVQLPRECKGEIGHQACTLAARLVVKADRERVRLARLNDEVSSIDNGLQFW